MNPLNKFVERGCKADVIKVKVEQASNISTEI